MVEMRGAHIIARMMFSWTYSLALQRGGMDWIGVIGVCDGNWVTVWCWIFFLIWVFRMGG